MPKLFKILTTITAWVLFINGFVMLIPFYAAQIYYGRVLQSLPMEDFMGIGIAVLSFIGGVFAMKVRRKIEQE